MSFDLVIPTITISVICSPDSKVGVVCPLGQNICMQRSYHTKVD